MKTTPSLPEILRLFIVRWPSEPIGAGAKWTLTESDIRRSYTLIRATPAEVEVSFEYEDSPSQTGSAKLTMNLADPLPTKAEFSQVTTVDLGAGDKHELATTLTLR